MLGLHGCACFSLVVSRLYSLAVAASPVAEHRLLARWTSVVAARGLGSCGSRALGHRLNSWAARIYLLRGMWDLPRPGIEPVSPTLAGGFFSTEPPGKPPTLLLSATVWSAETSVSNNPKNMTLVCYLDAGCCAAWARKQGLLRCMSKTYAGEREETNPINIQGPAASVRFLGIQGSGYPSKVKDKLLHLPPPISMKGTWTSLVTQWLSMYLPMQEAQV